MPRLAHLVLVSLGDGFAERLVLDRGVVATGQAGIDRPRFCGLFSVIFNYAILLFYMGYSDTKDFASPS
jgi:hypothetical protein